MPHFQHSTIGKRLAAAGRSRRERAGQNVRAGIRPCHSHTALNAKLIKSMPKFLTLEL
jgi:hypothetical protein